MFTFFLVGHNRREVLTSLAHPYGITILGTNLYWTDWETKSLQRADKNTGLDRTTIRAGLENLMDIKAWKVLLVFKLNYRYTFITLFQYVI